MPFVKQYIDGNMISIVGFENVLTLGRARDNDVVVEDLTVSQYHAKVELDNGQWVLKDCGSTNGIFVDGNRIEDKVLTEGDTFTLGTQGFEFSLVEPGGLDKTLKIKKSWIPGVYYTS